MLVQSTKKILEKQGYRIIGNHSACKICIWTKKSLTNKGICYKEKFYGIKSHRCCQMTPFLFCCNQCVFCWRDTPFLITKSSIGDKFRVDEPKDIIDNCISAQRELLNGFPGNEKTDKKKFLESLEPKHFAISLAGEPTFYPYLGDLIKELHKRGKTTFLVTNGLLPERLEKLKEQNAEPTQLYISLDAPTKELYNKTDKPAFKDAWQRLSKTLKLIEDFKRTVIRLTLVKDINMCKIEEYAKLIRKAEPSFVECKAYMFVGSSRERLSIENMPLHNEIMEFSRKLAKASDLEILDEAKESRVAVLGESDRNMKLI